jgi:O-antigen/teichoic acid export membrane protein
VTRDMNTRLKSVRGSILLASADAVGFACSFVRNMILARVLTTTDFGIAATFAMMISLLEFSGKMGVGQSVVRDRDGEHADFVAAAHLTQVSVGVVSAIVMFGAAWPLASVFGIADQRWALASLALIPLLRGCEHMDIRRFERGLRFGPSSLTELIPQVVITAAAWPVARWLGDYRAVLVLLVAKAVMVCVCTHLLAERTYRWSVRPEYQYRLLQFGWPLVMTGLIMFAVMQGEQLAIATFYQMSDVAPYAAAATLALMPVFFLGRVFSSILLPLLAHLQDDTSAFRQRYQQVLSALACVAGSCSVALILGGEGIMRVIYGAKYAGAGVLLAALAAAGAMRTVRAATALAAMARGDSRNELYSNGSRLVALLPAVALAYKGAPLWQVAYCGLLGEAVAGLVSIVRLRWRDGVPVSTTLVPLAWVGALVGLASFGVYIGAHRLSTAANLFVAALAGAVGAATIGAALPELRRELLALKRRAAADRGVVSLLRGSFAVGKTGLR